MRTLIVVLLATSAAWAQSSQAPTKTVPPQGPPPKNLTVRPDGHVSANQDPAEPDKFDVHIVKQGETLSGIAGEVLKNPRLWPQLWEENEHIINPHWIYPNDKVLIRPVTPLVEAKPPEPEPTPTPTPAPEPTPVPEPPRRVLLPPPSTPTPATAPTTTAQNLIQVEERRPVPQIKYEDLYCSGFVRVAPIPSDLIVIGKSDQASSVLAREGEYVYLNHGAIAGVAVGNVYQVVRPTKTLENPLGHSRTDRDLGMHYLDVGQLSVVLVQPDFSLARVTFSCEDAVDPGDIVMPFQRLSIPEPLRQRPFSPTMTTNSNVRGMIVSTKDVMLNFGSTFYTSGRIPGVRYGTLGLLDRGIAGSGTIVYIDLGQYRSVQPGDLFVVYRDARVDFDLYDMPPEVKKLRSARSAVGELLVLKVGERAATAVVTYAVDGLISGDIVERR
jgi:hypothetical protein